MLNIISVLSFFQSKLEFSQLLCGAPHVFLSGIFSFISIFVSFIFGPFKSSLTFGLIIFIFWFVKSLFDLIILVPGIVPHILKSSSSFVFLGLFETTFCSFIFIPLIVPIMLTSFLKSKFSILILFPSKFATVPDITPLIELLSSLLFPFRFKFISCSFLFGILISTISMLIFWGWFCKLIDVFISPFGYKFTSFLGSLTQKWNFGT